MGLNIRIFEYPISLDIYTPEGYYTDLDMSAIYYELDAVDGDARLVMAVGQSYGETDTLHRPRQYSSRR